MNETSPSAAPPNSPDEPAPGPPPALKAAVIGMGIILLLGFVAVLITIGVRVANLGADENQPQAGSVAVQAPVRAFGAVSLNVPDGSEILHTALDGARGMVTVRLGDGRQAVIVIDLATGAELGRLTAE